MFVSSRRLIVSILLWAALLVPAGVVAYGLQSPALYTPTAWTGLGMQRLWRYAILFLVVNGAVAILLRRHLAVAFAGLAILCSIYAVGPAAVGAVLLFVFSCTVLGRLLFDRGLEAPLAMLAGMAVWIALMTISARLPVHYPVTYAAGLLLPLAAGYRTSVATMRELAAALRRGTAVSLGGWLSWSALLFVLGIHWLTTLKPEASADGLAMHLVIADTLARTHALLLDPHHYVWAFMPMGGDWCYAIVYLLGGEYAARLLNFVMLLLIALLVVRACRAFLPEAGGGGNGGAVHDDTAGADGDRVDVR